MTKSICSKHCSFFFFLIIFFLSTTAKAQRQRPTSSTSGSYPSTATPYSTNSSPVSNDSELTDEDLDTIKVAYFFSTQPNLKIPFSDTTLNNHFQQYLPMRKHRAEYAYLGFSASPHRAIVWQPSVREGFDVGIHAFDLFNVENKNIKYFQSAKPFSEARWTVKSINNDSNFDFDFGAQYNNNNYASLQWHRTNQSDKPSYNFGNAAGRNSNWAVGVAHLGKRYQCFASMAINNFEQSHNGGISVPYSDSLRTYYNFNNGFPVFLTKAMTLAYRTQNFQWRHSYQLNANKTDSTASKRNYLILHQLDFSIINNKNFLAITALDTVAPKFFQGLYADKRGVRTFFDIKKIQNQVSIATEKPRVGQTPDVIELGLKHSFYSIYFEPDKSNVQNLFAFGKWNFSLSKWLKINTYAHLGLLKSNFAEYAAKGDMTLDLQQLGNLEVGFLQQRYQPTFLQSQFYNFQHKIWDNDFKKSFSTSLSTAYNLPKWFFSVKGSYHLLNNYIYFEKNLFPTQTPDAVNILQLEVLKDFHWRKIHLENYVALQKSTNNAINLPALYGKHGLYIEGKLFKKDVMLARLGADVRYTSAYNADAYHPFINQFYTQNDVEIPFFPSVDVYFSAKVGKLKTFVKVENITSSFNKKSYLTTVPNYPMYSTYLRIGFYRRFTD